jgi:UPF0755 protein
MRRRKVYNAIWNGMSFIMGTAFNWIILAATVYLIYIFMGRGFEYGQGYGKEVSKRALSKEDVIEARIEVKSSDTPETVSEKLQENGIILNALLFRLENMIKSYDTDYKIGEYDLNSKMSTATINSILIGEKDDKTITVTILEGFTIKDIAEYLSSAEVAAGETFVSACDEYRLPPFLSKLPSRINPLEGYLFPGAYELPEDPEPEDLIVRMLDRFQDVYSQYEDQAEELNLSMDEVIKIASIIEKEANLSAEKPLVSQVIYNRLEAGLKLEMLSPLLYRLEKRRDKLEPEDLLAETSYNTYTHDGLPLGPICNPSSSSIKAALEPAKGNFLYMVLNESSGEHIFTANLEEYEEAKVTYKQIY